MQMTIGKKLMAASAAMFLLTAMLGYNGMSALSNFKAEFDEAAGHTARKIVLADGIATAQADMVSAQRGIILGAFAKDPAEIATYEQVFRQNADSIQKAAGELRPMLVRQEAISLTTDVAEKLSEWKARFEELLRAASAGDVVEANRLRKDVIVPICMKLGADAVRLAQIEIEVLDQNKSALAAEYARNWTITTALLCLCFAVGLMSMYLVRGVTGSLRRAMTNLLKGAEEVTGAAVQVASVSQSVAQGASEQAASLEETAASGRGIHASATQNTERSEAAAALVNQSQQKFAQANRSLDEMIAAMNEINSSGNSISKIIRVIDELSFQTNILSLNAAVEAARAGEAGMGFAVVADAVRNLAQRSATAARDTAALIEGSISASQAGAVKVNEVATAIRAVAAEADRVKSLVEDVRTDSKEQAKGLDSVSRALMQIEEVTQRSAASAEETAASAQELNSQAAGLREIIGNVIAMLGQEDVQPVRSR